jgi:Flp pilus assembly pilin Flp
MGKQLKRMWRRGQALVEYGLLLALIALAVISALTVFGTSTSDLMEGESNSIGAAMESAGS